jgi:hypothetical protein
MPKLISSAFLLVFGLFAFGLASPAANAMPTLITDSGGQLLGADNVDLGSLGFFDVRFVDGTCISLFNGCDNAVDDFDFQSSDDATTAAQALLDQVFLNTSNSLFDSQPELTVGCDENSCSALIPFAGNGLSVDLMIAINTSTISGDGLLRTFASTIFSPDANTNDFSVYARFSPSALISIPEPSALLLFGFGLLGLAGFKWHRRQEMSPALP